MEILYAFLILFLVALWLWLHAYHKRRVAQARLEISEVILEMDRLMLSGEITVGEICHDAVYTAMLKSQRARTYTIKNWIPWRGKHTVSELKMFISKMDEEIRLHPKVGNLVSKYMRADFCVFKNSRPFVAFFFSVWVAICITGLVVILRSLMTILWANQSWNEFKLVVAECYSQLSEKTV